MSEPDNNTPFDYSYVSATARIALYDDLKSAPRVTEIQPSTTNEFIEKLTTTIYEQAKLAGGKVPYTLIREVSENFIHARFNEIVVSILDDGNTIRFADQGPGIREKERAQEPGFTSATEPMKKYIRGVGSGFPLVRDYLDHSEGSIVIEDNLVSGAVVTISLQKPQDSVIKNKAMGKESPATPPSEAAFSNKPVKPPVPHIPLSDREQDFIRLLMREGELGVTQISELLGVPASSTYNTLRKLEEATLVEKTTGKKRWLTDLGCQVAAII